MKVKEFIDLYEENDLILFLLNNKIVGDNGVYGIFGLKGDVNEYEIKSISSFYNRTGLYRYGVIVELKEMI